MKMKTSKQPMRTVETIDCCRYTAPDEQYRVKQIGMKKAGEVFEALERHLKEVNLLPDEYFMLDSWCEADKELPDFHTAICSADWGPSEGICLDVRFLDARGNIFRFATGKTLDESGDAFLRMSRIAAECSMMLNGRGATVKVSYENEEEKEKPNGTAYNVTITETLQTVVRIEADEADSVDEAEQLARDRWKKSEYILDAECFSDVEFEGEEVKA